MKAPNYDVASCLVCGVEFFDVGHRTFRRGVELRSTVEADLTVSAGRADAGPRASALSCRDAGGKGLPGMAHDMPARKGLCCALMNGLEVLSPEPPPFPDGLRGRGQAAGQVRKNGRGPKCRDPAPSPSLSGARVGAHRAANNTHTHWNSKCNSISDSNSNAKPS